MAQPDCLKRRALRVRRLIRLFLGLSLLPAGACDPVSAWLAGVDTEHYSWVPRPGTKHQNTWDKDLSDCLAPGTPAASAGGGVASGVPTISRSANSPIVITCMADKGYEKSYQARISPF
jgi:hypothetical protein